MLWLSVCWSSASDLNLEMPALSVLAYLFGGPAFLQHFNYANKDHKRRNELPSDREIFIFTPPFIVFDADYNTGCCCTHHSSILFKRERARVCVYGERGPRPFGLRAVVIYFTVQKLVKVFLRPFKRASCEREKGFFTSIKQRAHTHTT